MGHLLSCLGVGGFRLGFRNLGGCLARQEYP